MSTTANIYFTEARYELLRTLRMPGFAIPTILFPTMFYVFFGIVIGSRGGSDFPTYLLATYGTFGILSPALFGFGVTTATERGLGWLKLKRATPMPPSAYFVAKLVSALAFSAIVVMALFTLGATLGNVVLERAQWFGLAGVLLAGVIPFCAVGLAFGSWLSPQAAPPIVNTVFLAGSFLSGLAIPVEMFPAGLKAFASHLPPFHLAQLALGVVDMDGGGSVAHHLAVLAVTAIVALAIAIVGFRRSDER